MIARTFGLYPKAHQIKARTSGDASLFLENRLQKVDDRRGIAHSGLVEVYSYPKLPPSREPKLSGAELRQKSGFHSQRRARMGSTRVARNAGT